MKKVKKILSISTLIILLSLILVTTFAWIPRNWKPEIGYSNMQIEGTGSLVISFDKEGSESLTKVDLNQYLGKHTFSLKQVSSSNGIDFKAANFNPILTQQPPVYSDDVANKYLSTGFYIHAQGKEDLTTERYIMLDKSSFIDLPEGAVKPGPDEPDASEALRVAIIVENEELRTKETFIFCKGRRLSSDNHNVVTPEHQQDGIYHLAAANVDKTPDGQDLVPAGTDIFVDFSTSNAKNELNPAAIKDTICHDITKGITIAKMSHNSKIKISLNVWLEGCDPNCVNSINSKELKMLLSFTQREEAKK